MGKIYLGIKAIGVLSLAFCFTTIGIGILKVTPLVQKDIKNFGLLVDSARGTSMQIHKMSQAYGNAADAQAKYTLTIEAKTAKLLEDSDRTILHLDAVATQAQALIANSDTQVNGNVLPALTANLEALNAGLAQVQPLLETANKQVSNPDIAVAITNAKTATEHFSSSAANLEGVTADSKAIADHYKKMIVTPESKVKAVLKYMSSAAIGFFGRAIKIF